MTKRALSGVLVVGAFVMAGCAAEAEPEREPVGEELQISEGALSCTPIATFNTTLTVDNITYFLQGVPDSTFTNACSSHGYTSVASTTLVSSESLGGNRSRLTWRVTCERDCGF